jgi:glycerophosphoryl diester phosphodiesterase
VHGNPQALHVGDPGYQPYTTKALVDAAHQTRIKVIPWTIGDAATTNKLTDDGVDEIITDYPDQLREIAATRGLALPRPYPGLTASSGF